jgi:hypothetical protein
MPRTAGSVVRAIEQVDRQEAMSMQNALRSGTWPFSSHDHTPAAVAWRNLTSVRWALRWLSDAARGTGAAQYTAYRQSGRKLLLHPGVDDVELSMRDLVSPLPRAVREAVSVPSHDPTLDDRVESHRHLLSSLP